MTANRSIRYELVAVALLTGLTGCASSTTTAGGPAGRATDTQVTIDARGARTETAIRTDDQTQRSQVAIPFEEAWARVPGLVDELGLPVGYVNEREFRIGHRGSRIRRLDGKRLSNFLDCGMGATAQPYANLYDVTISYEIQLRIQEDLSAVPEMRFEGSAKPRDFSGASVRCSSKGTLETLVFERLAG